MIYNKCLFCVFYVEKEIFIHRKIIFFLELATFQNRKFLSRNCRTILKSRKFMPKMSRIFYLAKLSALEVGFLWKFCWLLDGIGHAKALQSLI